MADAHILRAARARIADPIHWTTGTYARNEAGKSVYPQDQAAICWCAFGAVRAGRQGWVGTRDTGEDDALVNAAFELFGTRAVAKVNDEQGHAAVLAMYDAAIATAEAGV